MPPQNFWTQLLHCDHKITKLWHPKWHPKWGSTLNSPWTHIELKHILIRPQVYISGAKACWKKRSWNQFHYFWTSGVVVFVKTMFLFLQNIHFESWKGASMQNWRVLSRHFLHRFLRCHLSYLEVHIELQTSIHICSPPRLHFRYQHESFKNVPVLYV